MIFDTLENLNQYAGMFENLDKAISFIEQTDLASLGDGRTDIDGDNVYVTVSEAQTSPAEGRPFETHSRYMDLQIVLSGTELGEVALGDLAEVQPYDEAADCALWNAQTSCGLVLSEGRFAVYMVEEPHKPGIRAVGCDSVRKAVFKIAY